MNATKLKSEVASYRLKLRNKPANSSLAAQAGLSMSDLIDIFVEAISSLERRIDAIDPDNGLKAISLSNSQPCCERHPVKFLRQYASSAWKAFRKLSSECRPAAREISTFPGAILI